MSAEIIVKENGPHRVIKLLVDDGHSNVVIDHRIDTGFILYTVKFGEAGYGGRSDGGAVAKETVSTGKLTGLQLRTIAARDQLEALLDDRCFLILKELAEASPEDFQYILKCAGESGVSAIQKLCSDGDMNTPDIRIAIRAMALFCYTEIIERGLKKPGQIE